MWGTKLQLFMFVLVAWMREGLPLSLSLALNTFDDNRDFAGECHYHQSGTFKLCTYFYYFLSEVKTAPPTCCWFVVGLWRDARCVHDHCLIWLCRRDNVLMSVTACDDWDTFFSIRVTYFHSLLPHGLWLCTLACVYSVPDIVFVKR